ncbi:Site-specific recombinase XerD [Variovorax sp. HW608]|uniref:site-specific integrase n=1 Tax=Variovorax sp. HW608 TaxID=1034889 RepID=UPI00081FB95E|nr:site-specific integrase [Variovorax sp. HW608]SCK54695.1 Site-specific recombinase XerD [Variovorax sp. HW608]
MAPRKRRESSRPISNGNGLGGCEGDDATSPPAPASTSQAQDDLFLPAQLSHQPASVDLTDLRPQNASPLNPDALSSIAEASVRDLLHQGQSANTKASYATAMRYWSAWFATRYGQPFELPVPIPVVLQFIVDHAERMEGESDGRGSSDRPPRLVHDLPMQIDRLLVETHFKGKLGPLALATLVHRVSVLSKAHQMRRFDNPCAYPGVRQLLRMVRVSYARRQVRPRQQAALTRELLEALLETCDSSPCGVRDRALLLFAWASGGRRRSEVANAIVENLQDHGERGFVYLLAHSKTNQEGVRDDTVQKPLVGRAANAMSAWLQLSGVQSGPIFRRILKNGRILAEPLAPRAVRRIVVERAALAGLAGHYSAHSLRSGFVTEAGRRQMPPADAMKMTGHKNIDVFMNYYRAGDLLNSPTARMLEGE